MVYLTIDTHTKYTISSVLVKQQIYLISFHWTAGGGETGGGGPWEPSAAPENVQNHEGARPSGFLEWLPVQKVNGFFYNLVYLYLDRIHLTEWFFPTMQTEALVIFCSLLLVIMVLFYGCDLKSSIWGMVSLFVGYFMMSSNNGYWWWTCIIYVHLTKTAMSDVCKHRNTLLNVIDVDDEQNLRRFSRVTKITSGNY